MSRYDDAFTLIVAHEGTSKTSSYRVNGDQLEAAVSDIDARIAKLEAEAKRLQYAPGDPNRDGQCRAVGDGHKPPKPEKREPGWYWVRHSIGDMWVFGELCKNGEWWTVTNGPFRTAPKIIGPYIPRPEGAV